MRSSSDRRRAVFAALLVGVGLLGVLAAWQGFAWTDTRSWVPDLLTGWTLAGLGVGVLARSRGAACLLFIAGVAWFVGDFHAAGPHWLGWLATHLSWVFLAPLVQLAIAYPSGRPRSAATMTVVAATWAATVAP